MAAQPWQAPVSPLVIMALTAGVAAWRVLQWTHSPFYPAAGVALPLAKGFVTISEMCFGLLFLTVSRNLITWLRSSWLRRVIDFDLALPSHKLLGLVGAAAGIAHAVCISIAYSKAGVLSHTPRSTYANCWWAWSSGWLLLVLALATYPSAIARGYLAKTRLGMALKRGNRFEMSHTVLIMVFTPLLLVHSIPALPSTTEGGSLTASKGWLFLAVPIFIYMIERFIRWRSERRKACVLDARILPGEVLELTLSKPPKFRFASGMYASIMCPAISTMEWHPFTITSAPQDPFVTMHIRKAGDWTAALHALVGPNTVSGPAAPGDQQQQHIVRSPSEHVIIIDGSPKGWGDSLDSFEHVHASAGVLKLVASSGGAGGYDAGMQEGKVSAASLRSALVKELPKQQSWSDPQQALINKQLPQILLDGPFGAPTQDWNEYEVVTLIGAGIGVTPMASVLRTLLHNLYDACCDNCGHVNTRADHTRQHKVYFHWVLRNPEGMAWFEQMLAAIAAADVEGRFELHVHITGLGTPAAPADDVAPADTRSSAGGVHAAAGGRRFSGSVHYSTGRPDFHTILSSIQAQHAGQGPVGVFFCGPPAFGHSLDKQCRQLNSRALKQGAASSTPTAAAAAGEVAGVSGRGLLPGASQQSSGSGDVQVPDRVAAVAEAQDAAELEAGAAHPALLHFFKEVF